MTKIRQYFYLVSGLIGLILPTLVSVHLLTGDQAVNITSILTAVGSLIGAGGALTAGVILGKQQKNGTFDPPAPAPAPADAAITAIQQTIQDVANAQSELDRVKQVTGNVLGSVPVIGSLGQQAFDKLEKAIKNG